MTPESESPPPVVAEWYERFGGVRAGALAPEPLRGGIAALRAAVARQGRNREGGHALLAADGLLTEAVLAGVDADDPEARFIAILAAVGREAEEDRG